MSTEGRFRIPWKSHSKTGLFGRAFFYNIIAVPAAILGLLHPVIARDAFIISLPVLKDHSFTVTTVSMKNMFGLAPERFYGGSWNKSRLHSPSTHHSVVDICLYKKPSLSIIDASVALTGSHLWGANKKLDFIVASFDPVAADAVGSSLLGHDPAKIEYLARTNGVLGEMDSIEVVS